MGDRLLMDISSSLTSLGLRHGEGRITGLWQDKHWMNTPGPIYGGQTDSCGTGPLAAPNNVGMDRKGYEIVFRQSVNQFELDQVIQATDYDPFAGYGIDGDSQWSPDAIRAWWSERGALEQELACIEEEQRALGDRMDYHWSVSIVRWRGYLHGGMHQYLRAYAFFLEERRIPKDGDLLPEV